MKPNKRNQTGEEEQELRSINDVLNGYRLKYRNKSKWLFRAHMFILVSWLVLRYIILQPVINYFKVLWEEQKMGLRYKQPNDE